MLLVMYNSSLFFEIVSFSRKYGPLKIVEIVNFYYYCFLNFQHISQHNPYFL